ncbi:SRPBCC family protein [Mucilaginibacter sp. X4EP1]|jgi:uncharacterized protein YndB with AHSA1/START domain|uniref:SRPBCC family protein n=1 Tax=Mucilaginibacter sp. X4EP1 TaxID=2723092 RepID=UPI00216A68DC|nr:SRPBCC domain-containing protein [Mucilaginibacter sp. X4EP1]MCS3812737.1 uncharacterized protein YndB with AHSA1/START domain [Mucilaginibacter sp. X4EP1]
MAKIIKHELFFSKPPEIVWGYLTQPELMALWLMPTDFQPVLGHEFKFTTKPKPDLELDGTFYCKVLEITPFTKLSYSWKFGPGNGVLHDSTVNWTLTESNNGTQLELIHRGIGETADLPIFSLLDQGWLSNIQKILKLTEAITDGTTPA